LVQSVVNERRRDKCGKVKKKKNISKTLHRQKMSSKKSGGGSNLIQGARFEKLGLRTQGGRGARKSRKRLLEVKLPKKGKNPVTGGRKGMQRKRPKDKKGILKIQTW